MTLDFGYSIIDLLLSLVLLIGLLRRQVKLIRPWLIFEFLVLTITVVLEPINAVIQLADGETNSAMVTMFVGLPLTALAVYFWIVVYSHFKNLKETMNHGFAYDAFANEMTESFG